MVPAKEANDTDANHCLNLEEAARELVNEESQLTNLPKSCLQLRPIPLSLSTSRAFQDMQDFS